jgi:hypothetical protein
MNNVSEAAFGNVADSGGSEVVPQAADSLFSNADTGAGGPAAPVNSDTRPYLGQADAQGDAEWGGTHRMGPREQPAGSWPFSGKAAAVPDNKSGFSLVDFMLSGANHDDTRDGDHEMALPPGLPGIARGTRAEGNATGVLSGVGSGAADIRPYAELQPSQFTEGFAQRIGSGTDGSLNPTDNAGTSEGVATGNGINNG